MFKMDTDKILLPQQSKYQYREVTYDITAHFCSDTDSLKSKINHLLKLDLQKEDSICTFAANQEKE